MGRKLGLCVALASIVVLPAPAGARSRPQALRGELPPEVKEELKARYAPVDVRGYFKERKAQEVDLNNDGVFDLIVEAEPAPPASSDGAAKKAEFRLAVFEKVGTRFRPIGELSCGDAKWKLTDGGKQWEAIACGKGGKYLFDEDKHAYRPAGEAAQEKAAAPVEKPPAFPPAYQAAYDVYKAGRYAEAAERLDAALGDQPSDEMLLHAGLANLKAHHLKRAREVLRALGEKHYLPAEIGLGDLAWNDGDKAGALAHYEAYLATNPPDSEDVAKVKRRVAGEEQPPPKKKAAE